MLPRYSLVSVQMANNLFKWWRTKVLNGYKQFSVAPLHGNDGRPSDTEELLGHNNKSTVTDNGVGSCGHVSESSLPGCSTPPPSPLPSPSPAPAPPTMAPTPTPTPAPDPPPDKNHLNLEEFSCDVSMEGGIYRDGQERQEFSFTLYDFDGHGKITKDDIAGLVTTIYETLGSSVKVPHYGSKTIKVKLTVSPDQRKRMSATVIDHKTPEPEQEQQATKCTKQHESPNSGKMYQQRQRRYREPCRRQKYKDEDDNPQPEEHVCCNYRCKLSDGEEYSDHCSRVSDAAATLTEDEGECSEDQTAKIKYHHYQQQQPKRYQKHARIRRHTHTNAGVINTHVPISPVLCTKMRRHKKRSSSLQRRELLEIIQANMEKNSHSFHTTNRKQCPNHMSFEFDQNCQHRHKHKASPHHDSTTQLQCLANMVNSENCYLDLSGLQYNNNQLSVNAPNTQIIRNPYCHYDKLLGAVVCVSNKQLLQKTSPLPRPLCRNRRHLTQAPYRYHLLEPHASATATNLDSASPCATKKSNMKCKATYETTEVEQTLRKNVKKCPQVVVGHSSSPHHMKHRNRQEDQARAMAQVVRWLEQEFSSNVHLNNQKSDKAKTSKCNTSSPNHSTETPSPSVSAVERHEHHHVHEHIHHHYHHYQEAPVVV